MHTHRRQKCAVSDNVPTCVQHAEAHPLLLGELMQQLALACSFASYQPSTAAILPASLRNAAQLIADMPAVNKQGLRDLARIIDSHLTKRVAAPAPSQSSSIAEKPLITQYMPAEAGAASGQSAPAHTDRPLGSVKQAPVIKQVQTDAAPSSAHDPGKLQAFTDSLRTGQQATVSNAESRAAVKRHQLREKLKANSAAAVNGAQTPDSSASNSEDGTSASGKSIGIVLDSDLLQPGHGSDALELRTGKKMGKKQRRKAAEASVAPQPSILVSTEDLAPGQPAVDSSTNHSGFNYNGAAGDLPAHPTMAQVDDMASIGNVSDEPAHTAKQAAASKTGVLFDETSSPVAVSTDASASCTVKQEPAAAATSVQADSAPVAHADPAAAVQADCAPAASIQADSDPTSQAASAPAQAGTDAIMCSSESESAVAASEARSGDINAAPTLPSKKDASSTDIALSQIGKKAEKDVQAVLARKPTQPAPTTAAPMAAGIAAHRPGPSKAVLRASAAPYTPLSSAAAAAKAKSIAARAVKPASSAAGGERSSAAVTGKGLQFHARDKTLL